MTPEHIRETAPGALRPARRAAERNAATEDGMENPRLKATLFAHHNSRLVWCEPHDREEHFLSYWYRLDCWHCGKIFDVRTLPGYTAFPRCAASDPKKWLDEYPAYLAAEQAHHADIVRRALDAGMIDATAFDGGPPPQPLSPPRPA